MLGKHKRKCNDQYTVLVLLNGSEDSASIVHTAGNIGIYCVIHVVMVTTWCIYNSIYYISIHVHDETNIACFSFTYVLSLSSFHMQMNMSVHGLNFNQFRSVPIHVDDEITRWNIIEYV